MRITRLAEPDDLLPLVDLYRHLTPDMPVLSDDRAQEIWREMLSSRYVGLFVTTIDATIVATCLLATAPNLMRGGAPHAILENVITHRDFRRQGHGRVTIGAALRDAWARGCHHVYLLTGRGRANPYVFSFYESCGFETQGKIGLLVLRPPGI